MPKIIEKVTVVELGRLIQKRREAIGMTHAPPSRMETAVQNHQSETYRELITAR